MSTVSGRAPSLRADLLSSLSAGAFFCLFLVLCGSPAAAADEKHPHSSIDLQVKELRLLSGSYGPGNPLAVAVRLVNAGTGEVRGATLATYVDGDKIGETAVPALVPGRETRIEVLIPTPGTGRTLKVVVLARPATSDFQSELSYEDNGGRIAIAVEPNRDGGGSARSVMWLTEPLYVVDAPYRIGPSVKKLPLLVMILNELPNENGWSPDLDTFNNIKLWVNGSFVKNLEGGFSVPNTRYWAKIYTIPVTLLDKTDDYNLIRVGLDRSWADDRGPDIMPSKSVWGNIIDPMTNNPLDNATWLTDGDYWYCRVFRSSHALPNVDGGHWFYGDTHHHTAYTDNPAEIGSPVTATAWAASSIGLSWLAVTDHSNDLDSDADAENFKDGLSHAPFTRPQPQSTDAKWADFLDQAAAVNSTGLFSIIAGCEVNVALLKADFPTIADDIFAHVLVYGLENMTSPIIGEGQDGMSLLSPIGKDAEKGASGLIPPSNTSVYDASRLHGDTFALWELLDFLQINAPGASVYLAHPIHEFVENSVSWTFLKMRDAWHLQGGNYVYEDALSGSYHHPLFHGFQLWNGAACFGNGIGKNEQAIDEGMDKYDAILQQDLAAFDPAKKLFVIGGSDAHGDFNSHTSRGERYNWDILLKRRDLVNVLGKVRTAVYIPDGHVTPQSALDALRRGRAVMTNGPMTLLALEFDGTEYLPGDHLTVPRSRLTDLKLRFRWATTPEFGPFTSVRLKVVGPTSVITPVTIPSPPDSGNFTLSIPGQLPGFAGWYALRVEGITDPAQALFQEPGTTFPYRCFTNPVWLEIVEG
jgi:hypothetical protein